MDGNQSMPGVKEVVFLLVFFAVFLFLIQHSFDLMAGDLRGGGARHRPCGGRSSATGGALDMAAVSIVTDRRRRVRPSSRCSWSPSSAGSWSSSPTSWRSWSAGRAPSSSTSWRRSRPILWLSSASTRHRQIGIGYLKSFGAVCLAGLIILDPARQPSRVILGGIVSVNPGTGNPDRRNRQRAHLRASVPGDVHPARALARQERKLGKGHRERLLGKGHSRGGGRLWAEAHLPSH